MRSPEFLRNIKNPSRLQGSQQAARSVSRPLVRSATTWARKRRSGLLVSPRIQGPSLLTSHSFELSVFLRGSGGGLAVGPRARNCLLPTTENPRERRGHCDPRDNPEGAAGVFV